MGTEGVQTRDLSTGMLGTSHYGHYSRTDPETQIKDTESPSSWPQMLCRPGGELLIMSFRGMQSKELSTGNGDKTSSWVQVNRLGTSAHGW